MTVAEWVAQVLLVGHKPCPCYIAIIPDDEDRFQLEVEISEGTIVGTFGTNTSDLRAARKLADHLEHELRRNGYMVFKSRTAWKSSIEETMLPLPHGGALCFSPGDDGQLGIRDKDGNAVVMWTHDAQQDDPATVLTDLFYFATLPVEDLVKTLRKTKVKDGCWV